MEPGETTKTRDRAPGLDGVRALAVLIVIGFHEGASGLSGGFLGVDIFFVLSGFLITDLLVSGYDRAGRMDLAGFWTRRARRLLPALAVMLVVVTAAATVIEPGQEASLRPALLAAATYTSNWYQILHHVSYFAASAQAGAPPPLDHLWSLAIEEQFYLLWPLIVWCLIIRLATRRARVTCALIAAAASALAMMLQYTPGGDPSAVYYGTDTHASALLIGAALALACPLRTLAAIAGRPYQAAGHRRHRRHRRPGLGRRALLRRRPGRLPGGPAAGRTRRRRPGRRGGGQRRHRRDHQLAAAALGWRQVLRDLPVALAGDRARHRAGGFGGQLALAVASRDGRHHRRWRRPRGGSSRRPSCGTACAPPSAGGCGSRPRPAAVRRARAAAPFRSRWPRPWRSPSWWPVTASPGRPRRTPRAGCCDRWPTASG